jgi:glucan biosynthesis protein
MSETKYLFEGREVKEVWESYNGDYWVITERRECDNHPYGFACLASSRQFAEWGLINREIVQNSTVWQVPKNNWTICGPEKIDIEKVVVNE